MLILLRLLWGLKTLNPKPYTPNPLGIRDPPPPHRPQMAPQPSHASTVDVSGGVGPEMQGRV